MHYIERYRSRKKRFDSTLLTAFYEERSRREIPRHFNTNVTPAIGLCYIISGVIKSTCEYFSITLHNDPDKFPPKHAMLHMAVRLPQNYVNRNSRIKGKWGEVESASMLAFQLTRGELFEIQILITKKSFLIAMNGFHFAEYQHRMSYKQLCAIDVYGDVMDVTMIHRQLAEYPMRYGHSRARELPFYDNASSTTWFNDTSPTPFLRGPADSIALEEVDQQDSNLMLLEENELQLPYYGAIPDRRPLTAGYALRIEGRVRILPQSFSIALQVSQRIWPPPEMSFYFSPSFVREGNAELGKVLITMAAFIKGKWHKRKLFSVQSNFQPGKAFVIVIACRYEKYELFVNNRFMVNFPYLTDPADVDMVNIRGDIRLWDVVIESLLYRNTKAEREIWRRIREVTTGRY